MRAVSWRHRGGPPPQSPPTDPRGESRPHIPVLVVTFDHAGEIDACLDAALEQQGVDVEVVVADNASRDATTATVQARGDVRLQEMGVNRGFAAGMNAAFAASAGEDVLILNPDWVMQPGCAAGLRAHLYAEPGVGLAGALLHDRDGMPQLFGRRDLRLGGALWVFTGVGRRIAAGLGGGRARAARRYADLWADGPRPEPVAVFCPAVARVMAARHDLQPAPFDERYPLLLRDAVVGAALHLAGRGDPREVRGTLGGPGLPGGPAPLLTPVRRLGSPRPGRRRA